MKLADIEFTARVKDDQSPDNNAQLSTELLLSGNEVHYLQPVNNAGKIILDAFDSNAIYQQLLALSQQIEPVLLDTGIEQIPVLFDYRQNPCVTWNDTRKLQTPPADFKDFFTVYLKAI